VVKKRRKAFGFGVRSLEFTFNSVKCLLMATIQKFEDLEIWQLARMLCQKVYPLTFEEPIAKDFRFKDQIRGTCGSVMDNIAEGFGRGSKLEFINALTIAKGEAEELKSQLYRGLGYQLLFSGPVQRIL